MRVAVDAIDERAAKTFQRKRSRDFQRLAGGDVSFDVAVAELAEPHDGMTRAALDAPGREVDHAVPGPQLAGGTAHAVQSLTCHLDAVRFAVAFAVKQEHRITTDDQRAAARPSEPRLHGNHIGYRSVTVGMSTPEKSRVIAIGAFE